MSAAILGGTGGIPPCPRETETAIDAVHRQLIDLPRVDGRADRAEPAGRVWLSSPAVDEQMGRPQRAGLITAHRAVFGRTTVGLDVTALTRSIESDAVGVTGVEEALRALTSVVLSTTWEGRHG